MAANQAAHRRRRFGMADWVTVYWEPVNSNYETEYRIGEKCSLAKAAREN